MLQVENTLFTITLIGYFALTALNFAFVIIYCLFRGKYLDLWTQPKQPSIELWAQSDPNGHNKAFFRFFNNKDIGTEPVDDDSDQVIVNA